MNALLLVAMLSCQGLDFGTTYAALHSSTGNFKEGNGFMRGHVYSIKIGANVGAVIVQQVFLRHAQSKVTQRALPIALAAGGCVAGSLNLHTMAVANHGK